eukprot:tig00020614_g12183.t1
MDVVARTQLASLRSQLAALEKAVASTTAKPARERSIPANASPLDVSELQTLATKTALDVEDLEDRVNSHREAILQIVGARGGPSPAQEGIAPEPLLTSLTRRLEALEGEVSSLRFEKASLVDKVGALEKELAKLTDAKGPLHALEYSVKRLWDERATLAKTVDTIGKDRIGKVEEEMRTITDPKGAVHVRLDSLASSVKNLWDERATLASRVDELEEATPGMESAAAAHQHGHSLTSPKPSPKLSPKVGPRVPDLNIARAATAAAGATTDTHALLTKLHMLESSIKSLWDDRARMSAKITELEEGAKKSAESLKDPKGPVQGKIESLQHSVKNLWDERAVLSKKIDAIAGTGPNGTAAKP